MTRREAAIRYRFKLYEGLHGAPLDKLGQIAEAVEKFLRSASTDADLGIGIGSWIAERFKEESLEFDAALYTKSEISVQDAERHRAIVRRVTSYVPGRQKINGQISSTTLQRYAEIGSALDAEEKIQVGIYSNGFDVPESPDEWHVLSGQVSKAIIRELNRPIESFGAVQGIIHALYKESDPKPYFNLRELSRKDKLIKCFYDNSIYSEIARALQRRENVVHAEGRITLSRSTGSVIDMDVSRIEAIKPLSQEEFESFFGSAPDLTGERSTVEYLRSVWNGDGER